MNKIDIVVQGGVWPNTGDAIKQYSELPFVKNIIFSTWADYNTSAVLCAKNNIKVITNKKPENIGQCNINLQIVSSLAGIKLCESPIVLKLRSDQTIYKESLQMMFEYFLKNSVAKKIMTHGINGNFPYHPNDQILMGLKPEMEKLFSLPLSEAPVRGGYNYNLTHFQADGNLQWNDFDIRPNIYLGVHYCANFDEDAEKHIDNSVTYLTDKAPKREEAMYNSKKILPLFFQPFPKIKLWWEKHQSEYPFGMYEPQGEYYGT